MLRVFFGDRSESSVQDLSWTLKKVDVALVASPFLFTSYLSGSLFFMELSLALISTYVGQVLQVWF